MHFLKEKKITTIFFVSNSLEKGATKKEIRLYESSIKEKLFQYEKDSNFSIFFVHLKNEQNIVKFFENTKIASSVLFMDDVEEEKISFFIEHIFKSKNCSFYFKGEVSIKNALQFTDELEHFLLINKQEMAV